MELFGSKDTVKQARDAVKAMCVGLDSVKKAKTQQLRLVYEALVFCEGEVVEDFALRL